MKGRRKAFEGAIPTWPALHHSNTPRPQRFAQRCGRASVRAAGFENSPSDVAHGLCCQPLEVGLASEARSTTKRWLSRKDDDSLPDEALTLSVGSSGGERSRENENEASRA